MDEQKFEIYSIYLSSHVKETISTLGGDLNTILFLLLSKNNAPSPGVEPKIQPMHDQMQESQIANGKETAKSQRLARQSLRQLASVGPITVNTTTGSQNQSNMTSNGPWVWTIYYRVGDPPMDFGQYLPKFIIPNDGGSNVQVTTYTFDTVSGSELCNSVWLDCTNYRIHDVTPAIWAANAPYKWFYLQGNNNGVITTNWRIDIVLYNCAKSVNCIIDSMRASNFEIFYPRDESPPVAKPLSCRIEGFNGNPNCDAATISLYIERYLSTSSNDCPVQVASPCGSNTLMSYWYALNDITRVDPYFLPTASPFSLGFTTDGAYAHYNITQAYDGGTVPIYNAERSGVWYEVKMTFKDKIFKINADSSHPIKQTITWIQGSTSPMSLSLPSFTLAGSGGGAFPSTSQTWYFRFDTPDLTTAQPHTPASADREDANGVYGPFTFTNVSDVFNSTGGLLQKLAMFDGTGLATGLHAYTIRPYISTWWPYFSSPLVVYVNVIASGSCLVQQINYSAPANPAIFEYASTSALTIPNPYTYDVIPSTCTTPTVSVIPSVSPVPATPCIVISNNGFVIPDVDNPVYCTILEVGNYTLSWTVSVSGPNTSGGTTALQRTDSITLRIICKVNSVSLALSQPSNPSTYIVNDPSMTIPSPFLVDPFDCTLPAVSLTITQNPATPNCIVRDPDVSSSDVLVSSTASCALLDVKSYNLLWTVFVAQSDTFSNNADIVLSSSITLQIACKVNSISFDASPQTVDFNSLPVTIPNPYTVSPVECASSAVITLTTQDGQCLQKTGLDYQLVKCADLNTLPSTLDWSIAIPSDFDNIPLPGGVQADQKAIDIQCTVLSFSTQPFAPAKAFLGSDPNYFDIPASLTSPDCPNISYTQSISPATTVPANLLYNIVGNQIVISTSNPSNAGTYVFKLSTKIGSNSSHTILPANQISDQLISIEIMNSKLDLTFPSDFQTSLSYNIASGFASFEFAPALDQMVALTGIPDVRGPVVYDVYLTDASGTEMKPLPFFISFNQTSGTLFINTQDVTLVGTYFLLFDAYLADAPKDGHSYKVVELKLTDIETYFILPPQPVENVTETLEPAQEVIDYILWRPQPPEEPVPLIQLPLIVEEKVPDVIIIEVNNPVASMTYMSTLGVLEFKFDQDMIVPQNLTYINDTVLDVQILTPELNVTGRTLAALKNDRQYRNVNFTWSITSFKNRSMDMQLYFREAYEVTADDKMQVNVLQKQFFSSNMTLVPLSDDNLVLELPCKSQMQKSPNTDKVKNFVDTVAGFSSSVTLTAFLFNLFLAVALSVVWGMINGMQLISLLPLTNTSMPGNVWFALSKMYLFSSFQLINVDPLTNKMNKLLHIDLSTNGLTPRLIGLEFTTTNVIQNLGIVSLFFICMPVFMAGLAAVGVLNQCGYQLELRDWQLLYTKKMYWNFFIRFTVETYIDQCIAYCLWFKNVPWHWTPAATGFTHVASAFTLVLMIMFPVACWILLAKHQDKLEEDEVKDKYEQAYDNVRTTSKTALGYLPIFTLKRLVYTCLLLLIDNHEILQTFLVVHMFFVSAAYTLHAKPLGDPITLYQESFNDIMALLISYSLIVFSNLVPDMRAQYNYGWFVCTLLAISVLTNIGIILYTFWKDAWVRAKVYCAKQRRRLTASKRSQIKLNQEFTKAQSFHKDDKGHLFIRRRNVDVFELPQVSEQQLDSFQVELVEDIMCKKESVDQLITHPPNKIEMSQLINEPNVLEDSHDGILKPIKSRNLFNDTTHDTRFQKPIEVSVRNSIHESRVVQGNPPQINAVFKPRQVTRNQMKTNALEGLFNINLSGQSPRNKVNEEASDYILPRRLLQLEKGTQRVQLEPQTISFPAFPAERNPVCLDSTKKHQVTQERSQMINQAADRKFAQMQDKFALRQLLQQEQSTLYGNDVGSPEQIRKMFGMLSKGERK